MLLPLSLRQPLNVSRQIPDRPHVTFQPRFGNFLGNGSIELLLNGHDQSGVGQKRGERARC